MVGIRLLGKPVRDQVIADLKDKVRGCDRPPGLAVVLVGENPASQVYVKHKEKACAEVGFHRETHRFAADASETDILDCIERLDLDERIDGILVQLPLPKHISQERVLKAVEPAKDVDGFHPENLGLLVAGQPRFVPCTPKGILRLLRHYDLACKGKRVAIVGRSVIVGRPLALLMSLKSDNGNATVTLCHSATPGLQSVTQAADMVVAAIGVPSFLKRDHIRQGAIVIDVGINRIADTSAKTGTRLVGDVDPEALAEWASAYTPVPGGVGPMTIAMLLENTWEAMNLREKS